MWSVSSSIFHRRQRKSGGEPCMEKWVMMSFSLAMDFHFLYSSSTFFFRLKRDSWGTLFCLKKAWGEKWEVVVSGGGSDLTWRESKCTWSGAGKHDSVWEAQLWGVKFMMVWRMSLHQVPWMESEPVKKSADGGQVSGCWVKARASSRATCDVRGSGQGEDQGSVQLLRLGWQDRLGVAEEAGELRLHFRTSQGCDQPQGRALHAGEESGALKTHARRVRACEGGAARYHRCSWFWLVWGTAARLCRWLSSWTL